MKESKYIEEKVEELSENIEFLHGVPVSAPTEWKDRIRKALLETRKQTAREIVEIIENSRTLDEVGYLGVSVREYKTRSQAIADIITKNFISEDK